MDSFQSGSDFFTNHFNYPADIKYHGLSNQGATCYLNSVLQVLFMTRDFREAVERSICENPDTEFIDRHLQDLFDGLKERITSTYKIRKKLSIDRVWEQKDAAEYYEKILAVTNPDASQIFHGQLTNKIVCSKCNTETNTDGSFWHLTLELEDSCSEIYSVVNGVEKYFRDSHFTGENQIYCERCDAKSDATIKRALKHHPEVLMLLLKRFKFNYSYMTYVKNNCGVDVPYTLQIPESQPYELYAVVDHFGDLRSGHYTASVKSQDNERWYNFNDTRVTLMDYQPFQVDDTEKLKNVYLLFYRRKETHAADTCAEDIKKMSISEHLPPSACDNNVPLQDAENIRERQDDEKAVDVGNDTAERNHDKGADDDELRISHRHQGWNEERNELRDQNAATETQEQDKGQTVRDHEEGGKMEISPNTAGDYQDNKRIGREEKMETVKDDKVNTNKQTPNSSIKYDFYLKQLQSHGGVGDSEQRMPEDDRWGKQGGNNMGNKTQQKEEREDVEGDKESYMHKPAQRKETTEPNLSRDVENQVKIRFDDVKHNRAEQKICVTHITHEDVGAEEQAKEQENKREEQLQNREEIREELTENHEVASLEKMGLEDFQPQETTGSKEVTVKGRCGSIRYWKLIEEIVEETPNGHQLRRPRKVLGTGPLELALVNGIKSQENIEGSTEGNTLLNDSPSPESQTHRDQSVIVNTQGENETETIIHKSNKKRQIASEAQMQDETERAMKRKRRQ